MEITMQGISKAFGSNEVLRGVDFTLHSGEIHALMGENGAGKTTMINLLMRFYEVDRGSISVDGVQTRSLARQELRQCFPCLKTRARSVRSYALKAKSCLWKGSEVRLLR